MAGDWIKMDLTTPEKPEVLAITAKMGWDNQATTIGSLFIVWRWFDQHTTNGNAVGVTTKLLDRLVGVTDFCFAMQSVGWLEIYPDRIVLPNFDYHNGKTAKQRAMTAKRVGAFRVNNASKIDAENDDKSNEKCNGDSVTSSVTTALAREEKRRIKNTHTIFVIPKGVDQEIWDAWLLVRKSKKATAMSDLVIAGMNREAAKAGIDLNAAILKCVEKNWISFDADWVNKNQSFAAKPVNDPFEGAI